MADQSPHADYEKPAITNEGEIPHPAQGGLVVGENIQASDLVEVDPTGKVRAAQILREGGWLPTEPGPGLYTKYSVTRNDGKSEPGGKHENCRYFVLDLDHDPFAKAALRAYAIQCRETHPELSRDIFRIITTE